MSVIDATKRLLNARGRVPAVAVCACASLVLYLLLPVVLSSLSETEPSYANEVFSWVKPATRDSLDATVDGSGGAWPAVRFVALCAGLFGVYGLVLRLVKGCRSIGVQALLFASGAVFLLTFLFAPVLLSEDIYSYAFYGRIFSVYGSSPYLLAPAFNAADPFYAILGHRYVPSVYGPCWTLLSAGLARVGGVRVGLVVLLFRGWSCVAVLAGAALLWGALRRHSPERAAQGLALFLWNPLVLIEGGLSGHNDATMVALLLLAVWLHVRGRKAGAVAAFTLSALVKFVTGPLVPLYMLMVLRRPASWRERGGFLLRSGLAAGAILAAFLVFGRVKSDVPAARFAASPQFFSNNFHELILTGMRRLLGEDAESVRVPVTFGSYWVSVTTATDLRESGDALSSARAHLPRDGRLLVIAPHLDADWLRVFDPVSRRRGYVYYPSVDEIADPDGYDNDPDVSHLEDTLLDWPTVLKASALVHNVFWSLFAVFGLIAAWRTRDFDLFLIWAAAVMLASYYTLMTQFWPWYVIWAVALGALKPEALPAKFALLLSASVLTLYITLGCEDGDHEWIYVYRSLFAVVLPLLLFGLYCGGRFRLFARRRLVESGPL